MAVVVAPTRSTPVKAPRHSWRTIGVTVLAFVFCQALAIAFVEFVFYMAGLGEEEIFHFDPQIGFVHIPDKRITWRSEGFAQSSLNNDGMREPGLTVDKPADTYRVALLGDSMVEAFQVPLEQTFGRILQEHLTPLSGNAVQVLNFGVSGYSTVQEYLLLKRSVLKYKPDLVVVCYNSRDIFENWSPPDQVLSNVWSSALRVSGGKLVIDNQPVLHWMRSTRGRFMMAISWFREHSRIVGMLGAMDRDLSLHDRFYRAFIDLLSHPKNAPRDLQEILASFSSNGPSFKINFFEDLHKTAAPATATTAKNPSVEHSFNSAANNESLSKTPMIATDKSPPLTGNSSSKASHSDKAPSINTYKHVISLTLGSLFDEMRAACAAHGCEVAVIALPVRSQLCPLPGSDTQFAGIDYAGELEMVRALCAARKIPYCDVEEVAERLPMERRDQLFYAAHLKPEGQRFVADSMQPLIRDLLLRHENQTARKGLTAHGGPSD